MYSFVESVTARFSTKEFGAYLEYLYAMHERNTIIQNPVWQFFTSCVMPIMILGKLVSPSISPAPPPAP